MGLMGKTYTNVTFFFLHWLQFGTFPLAKGGFCNEREWYITSCRSLMTDWTIIAFALDRNGMVNLQNLDRPWSFSHLFLFLFFSF